MFATNISTNISEYLSWKCRACLADVDALTSLFNYWFLVWLWPSLGGLRLSIDTTCYYERFASFVASYLSGYLLVYFVGTWFKNSGFVQP